MPMSKNKNQHVTPPPQGGWQVKGAGNERATAKTTTQAEAIEIATQIAKNKQADTKIHGKNGRIRAGNSYGNDPHPPKDNK